jgi:hypothetical protein
MVGSKDRAYRLLERRNSTSRLEMEKQQIKSAFIQGELCLALIIIDGINPTENNYYSETYKKDTHCLLLEW